MVVITIELETAKDEARLLELLPTIHGRVVAKEQQKLSVDDNLEARKQHLKTGYE